MKYLKNHNQDSVKQCITLFEMIKEHGDGWFTILNEETLGHNSSYAVCGKAAPEAFAKYEKCAPFNIAEVSSKCAVCAKRACDVKFCFSNGY